MTLLALAFRACGVVFFLLRGAKAQMSFEAKTQGFEYLQQVIPPALWAAINPSSIDMKGFEACKRAFTKGRETIRDQPFLSSGLVLSTGKADSLVPTTGSNTPNTGTRFNFPGDGNFTGLTRDACSIEFDFFSPNGDDLYLDYVFASEEYPDKVGSASSDEFALFLNGENIALVPGSTPPRPVSINNVNRDTSQAYFNNNDPSEFIGGEPYPDFQPDGFTTKLIAMGPTKPGKTNHLKFVIADGGDAGLDSWLLLSNMTFTPPRCENVNVIPYLNDLTSMGSVLGGDLVKIHAHPSCLYPVPREVYCRFEGSTMDEIVPGVLVSTFTAAPDTIECVTPYSGLSIGTAVSFGFYDPRNGPFDKFRIVWTPANKEYMFFGSPNPQVQVVGWMQSDAMVVAGTRFDTIWDNDKLINRALNSLNSDPPTLTAADLEITLEIAVFDDELAFQVVDTFLVPPPWTGYYDPVVQESTIRHYFDYGYGGLAVVKVRVVASHNGRVGATISSDILAAFASRVNPICNPRPSARCDGFNVLPNCPPTLSYVQADLAFTPDFYECPWGYSSGRCKLYSDDVAGCFRADAPSPSITGQRCCYSNAGALLPGEYVGKATADCVAPTKDTEQVVLHFAYDVVPYYLCCLVSSATTETCSNYYNNRPSPRGVLEFNNYKNPTLPGWAWGDPHFVTLDGFSYDFNGAGEYVAFCGLAEPFSVDLLSVCNPSNPRPLTLIPGPPKVVSVHFRFEPVTTGPGKATKTVGVAIEDYQHHNGTRAIAVVPNPILTRRVDIFDGDHLIEFPKSIAGPVKTLVLSSGVTIIMDGEPENRHLELAIYIETPSGIRLKIIEKAGVMFPSLEVHERYKNQRGIGLLGYVDGNAGNDLTPSTMPLRCGSTLNNVFDFGESWKIEAKEQSLFQDLELLTENFAKYDFPCYKPNFDAPLVAPALKRAAETACGLITDAVIRAGCEFDILVTGDRDRYRDAAFTVEDELAALQIRKNSLPTIDSGLYSVVLDLNNGFTFSYSVADAETLTRALDVRFFVSDSKQFCDGSSLFSHSYNNQMGTGRIVFSGTGTECKYAAWVTVSDGLNTVLSTFVANVRRITTNARTCAERLRNACRCAGNGMADRYTKVLNCVKPRIKRKCTPPVGQVSQKRYAHNVASWAVKFSTRGCPPRP